MTITYNKQVITKDRRIQTSGPRDCQRKQQLESMVTVDDSALIEELRHQIVTLQNKLDSRPVGKWTDDMVNVEIMKAIQEETETLNKQYSSGKRKYDVAMKELEQCNANLNQELNHTKTKAALFEKDVAVLNDRLKEKETVIEELKVQKPVTGNNVTDLLADATKKIETLMLQVTSAGSADSATSGFDRPKMETVFVDPIEREEKVESHIKIEDVSINEKEQMVAKVNKLKNLMGKLPVKRG